ncbi:hypothetical protein Dimus_009737 [Dionaea muscipula]
MAGDPNIIDGEGRDYTQFVTQNVFRGASPIGLVLFLFKALLQEVLFFQNLVELFQFVEVLDQWIAASPDDHASPSGDS